MPKPLAVVPELESELDTLYGLPPADFTRARNDLAKRLKQAGQADAAAEIGKLRKPTVPVWAANQLVRQQGTELEALLESSDRLRDAQRAALSGKGTEDLRTASAAQREALQALTQHAHDLLSAEGTAPTAATIERLAATLRAAALDPGARELLRRGRLSEELDPSGFDAFAGMPLPKRAAGKRGAPSPARERDADRRRRERIEKLRRELEEAEAAAEAAVAEAKRAEADAAKKRAAAERIRARLEKSLH